ncbi:solute carrier family 35 member F2-like [Anthonomus grandis grandis]|uniref:solute carrier family 35 member F2-like n=1 Tax=Anthonomus grandis grandis TaxID=2921223 RepID=UPI002166590E|nr:solute carrier family 35 member F2-like [Anthonomus grandis grandis]
MGDNNTPVRTGFCDKLGNNLSELGKWSVWQNIILGQFLSLILCGINTLGHYLNTGSSEVLPTGQSFPHYLFLCAIYTSWLAFRRGDKGLISIIRARGWRYLLLCIIDVEANTLMSTAHQFTTLTSIQLLGCVAIPVALALSCLVLGVRYRMVHILAVSVCLIGVGCLVWANIEDTKIDGKNQLVGDMLCLGGAVLFAIVTVLQELSVKNTDIVEYLGLLGLFGSIISGLQMLLLEQQTLVSSVTWKNSSALLSSFSACQFMFCTFSSVFLLNMGTTALHLSLLSGNFYTLIIGILLFNYKFHALYFLSYTLSMTGVYIYAIKRTSTRAVGNVLALNAERNHHHHHHYHHNTMPYQLNNRQQGDCQMQDLIVDSEDRMNEILLSGGGFGTLNSTDTFPLSHSTNTTFTSFYGSHDILGAHQTTTA